MGTKFAIFLYYHFATVVRKSFNHQILIMVFDEINTKSQFFIDSQILLNKLAKSNSPHICGLIGAKRPHLESNANGV